MMNRYLRMNPGGKLVLRITPAEARALLQCASSGLFRDDATTMRDKLGEPGLRAARSALAKLAEIADNPRRH